MGGKGSIESVKVQMISVGDWSIDVLGLLICGLIVVLYASDFNAMSLVELVRSFWTVESRNPASFSGDQLMYVRHSKIPHSALCVWQRICEKALSSENKQCLSTNAMGV